MDDWIIPTHYENAEYVSKGDYGTVCSALDKKTDKMVCIKRVSPIFDYRSNPKIILKQIKILKHVSHENLINLIDIYSSDDVNTFNDIYLVFPFMEQTLHDRIYKDRIELTDDDRMLYMYQILQGLRYLHSCKIIHRDLNPTNITLTGRELKINDFGLSRKPNEEMVEYVVTSAYRAPETIFYFNRRYNKAADIWSAGCILAEMYIRRILFNSHDFLDLLCKIIRAVGYPSDKYISELNPYLEELFATNRGVIEIGMVKKFSDNFPEISMETEEGAKVIGFLFELLQFNPRQRLDANAALRHSYLSRYYDKNEEIAEPPFINDFDNYRESIQDLRTKIFNELGNSINTSIIES